MILQTTPNHVQPCPARDQGSPPSYFLFGKGAGESLARGYHLSMSMQIFSIPPSMAPDLHEKTSPLAKYQKSGLAKLEALYGWQNIMCGGCMFSNGGTSTPVSKHVLSLCPNNTTYHLLNWICIFNNNKINSSKKKSGSSSVVQPCLGQLASSCHLSQTRASPAYLLLVGVSLPSLPPSCGCEPPQPTPFLWV